MRREEDTTDKTTSTLRAVQTILNNNGRDLRSFLYRDIIRNALKCQELDILDLRLLAEKTLTLQEIGVRHHISRERVRQIEDRLIKRLRQFLKAEIADWGDYHSPLGD